MQFITILPRTGIYAAECLTKECLLAWLHTKKQVEKGEGDDGP